MLKELCEGVCMICDDCGKEKADVKVRNDPYKEEIEEKIIEKNYCDDCYQERLNDI